MARRRANKDVCMCTCVCVRRDVCMCTSDKHEVCLIQIMITNVIHIYVHTYMSCIHTYIDHTHTLAYIHRISDVGHVSMYLMY
jgi:hypothetical protein